MTESDYLSIRATISNEPILIEEYQQLKFESGRSDKDIIKEALTMYLLDESEDNRLTVKKK